MKTFFELREKTRPHLLTKYVKYLNSITSRIEKLQKFLESAIFSGLKMIFLIMDHQLQHPVQPNNIMWQQSNRLVPICDCPRLF